MSIGGDHLGCSAEKYFGRILTVRTNIPTASTLSPEDGSRMFIRNAGTAKILLDGTTQKITIFSHIAVKTSNLIPQ
jgi:hypothetical protein